MDAKFLVALILALQVSVSLCHSPTPSPELVEKYFGLRATFKSRIDNLLNKWKEEAAKNPDARHAQLYGYLQSIKESSASEFAGGVAEQVSPHYENARNAALGWYEHYLRPHIGEQLDETINRIKPILNEHLPAQ